MSLFPKMPLDPEPGHLTVAQVRHHARTVERVVCRVEEVEPGGDVVVKIAPGVKIETLPAGAVLAGWKENSDG